MTAVTYEQVLSYDTAAVARGNRRKLEPCAIQPRDLDLIEAVKRCKFLTTPQLLELWWPGAAPQVGRRRLSKLFEAGYLDRFRPVARRGSFPWTYKLGREGHRLLQRVGRVAPNERFETREIYDYRYVLHEIHLYSWVLAWRRLLGEQLLRWDGEVQVGTRVELQKLQRSQAAEISVEGLRDRTAKPVRPDAVVEVARPEGVEPHVFMVEYDRTRRVDKNFEKFRRYDVFTCWWWRHSEYGHLSRPPWVIFICQDEEQRSRFLTYADKEVCGRVWDAPEDSSAQQYPGRHRMLFVNEEDMYAGEAIARRLPALPPGHPDREPGGVEERPVRLPGAATEPRSAEAGG